MSTAERLEAAGEILPPAVRAVVDERDALVMKLAVLEERLRELEARLGQNSTNSSKPPSSDPPGVKRREKKPTGRKRGGQEGHKGHHRKLLGPERVDEVVVHRPEACRHCGEGLAGAPEGKRRGRHQVVELPPIRAHVTEHQVVCARCPRCRRMTRAGLPAGVRGRSFGPRLTGLVVLLTGGFRLSRRETRDLVGKLLDVPPPSLGSTQALAEEVSEALRASHEEVREAVRKSGSACVDETSWKRVGKLHWLWTAVAEGATLFHLGPSRGSQELKQMLGEGYGGIVTSDRWSAYRICPLRQLCWAHLQRNLESLALRGGEAAGFARRGLVLCARLFETVKQVREGSLPRSQLPMRMERYRARFRWLLQRGSGREDRRVAAFSKQLLKLWPSLWNFLEHPIEPTNNAAERALRRAVLWRKGSFGSQSDAGLRFVERMLTLTETCRQHRLNPLDFLSAAIFAHRSGTSSPKLLPAD